LSTPDVRFVIVPQRPRPHLLVFVLVLAWLVTLWAAYEVSLRIALPQYSELKAERDRLTTRLADLDRELDTERQQAAVLSRSDQISRAANESLQQTVVERDEEIAALRTDVGFYERLVGGSAQRKGLAVHALALRAAGGGDLQYAVTLTQTLKRSGHTEGELSLEIEGVRDGQLETVGWAALRAGGEAAGQAFAFRYFQQLEGSIMLPANFTPHRVRVEIRVGDNRIERIFPWQEVLPQQGA